MKVQHLTEEQFAAMVKGMKDRANGSVDEQRRSSVADREPVKCAPNSRETGRSPVSSPAHSPTFQQFFVPGPLPGANEIIRKHWRVYDRLKKEWGLTIARCLLVAKIQPMRSVAITYHWIEPTPRRGRIRDRDNIRFGAKFINDAIVTHGVLLDDGPDGVVSMTDTFAYDGDNPGVRVTLEERT